MTREKKKAPAPAHGVAAAARRAKMERALHYSDTVWRSLNPLKAPPKVNHRSYFEAVENTDKKKKLEFEITTNPDPPPGFEFIPTGHPELSQECKEQSRKSDAMFFIVSISKNTLKLDHHMNRLGYHFRCSIVEEARKVLNERGHHDQAAYVHKPGKPEPIPSSQREIDQEADAVLRDLFPRIPNTDRRQIIDHAFKKDGTFNGEFKVGMAKDITLARRVQLAALAHIRHTHTRYDQLLKESDWANARKAVEKPCLDIIVKWRGDEETGRDQLDEILREVIEISDTESESEDEESSADNAHTYILRPRRSMVPLPNEVVPQLSRVSNYQPGVDSRTSSPILASPLAPTASRGLTRAERRTVRKTQQRFKRYAAAAEALAGTDQNGQQRNSPINVATPMEVVGLEDLTQRVGSYHTRPSTVAYGTYMSSIPDGHMELRQIPASHPNSSNRTRTAEVVYDPSDPRIDEGMGHFIRVPDAQRPKVGPYSANYSLHPPQPPLSPVRLGLQDMLLPSIEPRSPASPRVVRDAHRRVNHESQQLMGAPQIIHRTAIDPVVLGPRPQSPGAPGSDDEFAAKRRRVITYFPEDFQGTSGSPYTRIAPRSQEHVLYRPHIEYQRQPLASQAPEHRVYQNVSLATRNHEYLATHPEVGPSRPTAHPIPVATEQRLPPSSRAPDRAVYLSEFRAPARHDPSILGTEAPLSSRARPIVIDDCDSYEPRRIVEVRGSPAHQLYRTDSSRSSGIHTSHIHRDSRIRHPARVIYTDEPVRLLRSDSQQDYDTMARLQPGQVAGLPTQSQPQLQPRSCNLNRPTQYPIAYDRDAPTINRSASPTFVRPNIMARERQPDVPRPERFSASRQYDYHQPSLAVGVTAQQSVPQQQRDNISHRNVRPHVILSAGIDHEQNHQQPFPVYPAPSSYAEIRGPPVHRRLPDNRDIIYVE